MSNLSGFPNNPQSEFDEKVYYLFYKLNYKKKNIDYTNLEIY